MGIQKILRDGFFKVGEYENNYYHDSDFFDVVFNPETKEVMNVFAGSTRGAGESYSSGYPMSSQEVQDMYLDMLAAQRRHARIVGRWNRRKALWKILNNVGIDLHQYNDLAANAPYMSMTVQKFLGTNFRNAFKKNLKNQMIVWAKMPKSERKFDMPLSYKQQRCI